MISSIQVIADISCDVDGSVPATVRTTTISEPVLATINTLMKPPHL